MVHPSHLTGKMAETPIRQHGRLSVNNSDHNTDSNVCDDIPTMSKEEFGQSYQRRFQKIPSMDTNPKKKSSFVITRVIKKSVLSDHTHEDQDSVDDLDETNTEEFSSDILDTSKQTDIEPDPSSEDTVHSIATEDLSREVPNPVVTTTTDTSYKAPPVAVQPQKSDPHLDQGSYEKIPVYNIQSLSRFKVVKIESSQPFRRGRWTCQDFLNPPSAERLPEKVEKSFDDVGSGNSSAASSVHYVPGVDDPAKNPLSDGFHSLAQDSHEYTTPAVSQPLVTNHTAHAIKTNVATQQTKAPYETFDPSAHRGSIIAERPVVVAAPAAAAVSTNGQPNVPTSFNQTISQVTLQTTANEQATTEYIPTSEYIPTQDFQPSQPVTAAVPVGAAAGTTANQPATSQGANVTTPRDPPADIATPPLAPDASSDFQAAAAPPVAPAPNADAVPTLQPPEGADPGYQSGAEVTNKQKTAQVQAPEQVSARPREPNLPPIKPQTILTPPLLMMVNAMQPQGANKDDER